MRADARRFEPASAAAPIGATPLVRLAGAGYRTSETNVLSPVSLAIPPGAPTVVMGPNGSGKTTLLKLMMGLIAPTCGSIAIEPRPDGTAPRSAFLFQRPVMLKRTAAANVAFALTSAGRDADARSIGDLLRLVGLEQLAERPARRLSVGEQQRLALARALARDPELLFLDEPSASLDPAQTQIVEHIIATTTARGVKIVMATHDLGQARRLAGDVVFLAAGSLAEHAPASRFFERPASERARRFLAGELVL